MHHGFSRRALFVPILVLGFPLRLRGRASQLRKRSPHGRPPVRRAIHTATLPNGPQYFVRRNDQPAKRISLRLAVKAGSLDEADDSAGVAHFIEHMAFNAASFQAGRSVLLLRVRSVRGLGRTSTPNELDETVYMLDLPPTNRHCRQRADGARRTSQAG